jgi:hypothetical protein
LDESLDDDWSLLSQSFLVDDLSQPLVLSKPSGPKIPNEILKRANGVWSSSSRDYVVEPLQKFLGMWQSSSCERPSSLSSKEMRMEMKMKQKISKGSYIRSTLLANVLSYSYCSDVYLQPGLNFHMKSIDL